MEIDYRKHVSGGFSSGVGGAYTNDQLKALGEREADLAMQRAGIAKLPYHDDEEYKTYLREKRQLAREERKNNPLDKLERELLEKEKIESMPIES